MTAKRPMHNGSAKARVSQVDRPSVAMDGHRRAYRDVFTACPSTWLGRAATPMPEVAAAITFS